MLVLHKFAVPSFDLCRESANVIGLSLESEENLELSYLEVSKILSWKASFVGLWKLR